MPDRVISVPQAQRIVQATKNQFDNINGRLQKLLPVNLGDSITWTNGKMVKHADGVVTNSNYYNATSYINISDISEIIYTRVVVTQNQYPSNGMSFYDANKAYISGIPSDFNPAGGGPYLYKTAVPEGAVYARFSYFPETSDQWSNVPFAVYDASQYENSIIVKNEKSIEQHEEAIDQHEEAIDHLQGEIGNVNNILMEQVEIDLSTSPYAGVILTAAGKWSSYQSATKKSWFVPLPDEVKQLNITANSENNAIIAFLTTQSHVDGETPDYATGSGRTVIPVGTTETFDVPNDAVYLCIVGYTGETIYTPSNAVWIQQRQFGARSIPLGLHEMPDNNGVVNLIKRCRQMTDIEWTPAVDLKRLIAVQRKLPVPDTAETEWYLGTFKAGTKYKGIPYGRVAQTVYNYGYDYGTVGHYIDFETFISSVSNSKSRMCKENVGSASGHRSVIYATVCSGFTCYALNVPEVSTVSIPNISGLSLIGKINDDGTLLSDNSIKIGDILNKQNTHTAIITDIIRDAEGVIQSVEISEATVSGLADRNYSNGAVGGLCRRKGWNRDLFFREGWWGDFLLYRYTKASEIPYVASPYVNVGDEFDDFNIEHFPVMPYEGEGFTYKTGYIPNNAVKLVITLEGYNYLKVFKDGIEITGSPFAVTSELDDIIISEISAGEYEAYLCNMESGEVTNLTYPCSWKIV